MKKKILIVSHNNLPTKLPLTQSIAIYLLLDHLSASELWRGMVYTLLAIMWIATIIRNHYVESVDIFKDK